LIEVRFYHPLDTK